MSSYTEQLDILLDLVLGESARGSLAVREPNRIRSNVFEVLLREDLGIRRTAKCPQLSH